MKCTRGKNTNDQIFSISIEDKQKLNHCHFFGRGAKRENVPTI